MLLIKKIDKKIHPILFCRVQENIDRSVVFNYYHNGLGAVHTVWYEQPPLTRYERVEENDQSGSQSGIEELVKRYIDFSVQGFAQQK